MDKKMAKHVAIEKRENASRHSWDITKHMQSEKKHLFDGYLKKNRFWEMRTFRA